MQAMANASVGIAVVHALVKVHRDSGWSLHDLFDARHEEKIARHGVDDGPMVVMLLEDRYEVTCSADKQVSPDFPLQSTLPLWFQPGSRPTIQIHRHQGE